MKNKKILSLVMLIVLGISACTAPSNMKSAPEIQPTVTSTIEDTSQKEAGSTSVPEPASTARYVEYSKSILEQSVSMRRVLFFYASWCSTCRPADTNFVENTNLIPEDLVLIRVNYNDPQTDEEEKALAAQHGITYQHTFVQIDGQGNAVAKWNGGQINELLAQIK